MPRDAVAAEQPAVPNGADIGLDAEEQAAYEAMHSEPAPTGDAGFVPPATEEPAPAPEPPAEGEAPTPDVAAAPVDPDDDDEGEETAPAADGKSSPPQKRVGWTKYARLQDELKAEKAARETDRSEKQKMAENQARLDERLRLINEALTPPAGQQQQQDEDPEPDPETDIFGHNAWLKRNQVRMQQAFDERIGQIENSRQTETTDQQIASTYVDDAQRFAQTEPNFGPAYNYLMQVRTAQLASFHFGKDLTDPATTPLTQQEFNKIKSEVAREEKTLVSQALKSGKSPAAAVFAMARMTGYRPDKSVYDTIESMAKKGFDTPKAAPGATHPFAPTADVAKPSVKAEIDRIKAGQDASLSLSHGGGAPAPVLNAAKIADMPQDKFEAMLEDMSRGEFRRMMGG